MNENDTEPENPDPRPPAPVSQEPATPREPEREQLHARLQMETHQGGQPDELSRRNFFTKLCIGLTGVCAVILGTPVVGFIISP